MRSKTSFLVSSLVSVGLGASDQLPLLYGDPESVTVSGFNAGATFACMLQVILSDTIKGASCMKGAAFGTSNGQVRFVTEDDIEDIVEEATGRIDELELEGLVDPTQNLRDRAVIIYSGTQMTNWRPENQRAAQKVFLEYMQPSDFIELVEIDEKNQYRAAYTYETLKYIYDALGYTSDDSPDTKFQSFAGKRADFWEGEGDYLDFDQTEFFDQAFEGSEYDGRAMGKIFILVEIRSLVIPIYF